MTVKELKLIGFLKSKTMTLLIAMFSIIAAVVSMKSGDSGVVPGLKGLGFPSPNTWFASAGTSFNWAWLCYLGVGVGMVLVNRIYNLLRTLSLTFASYFVLMVAATPIASVRFYGGTLLVVLVLAATVLLFSTFNKPANTRHVFLGFLLLTAGALTQYGFVPYIPILLMGCGQMRIFRMRTFLAALLGIVTPVWICYGFGWIDFSHFSKPKFDSVFSVLSDGRLAQYLAVEVTTALLLVGLIIANMIKIYSYNLRTRAMNGFVLVVSFTTILLSGVDFTNMPFYFPLLCCCTAFQLGHFLRIKENSRAGYIVALAVLVVYVGLYIWSTAI